MRKALADEKEEDPECTFQPKISEKSQQIVSQMKPDFIERNNMWMEQKKEKLKEKESSSKDNKEMIHCTFQPQLVRFQITSKTAVLKVLLKITLSI